VLHECLIPDQEYPGHQITGVSYHQIPRICWAPPRGRDHRPQHLKQGIDGIDGASWIANLQNRSTTLSALADGTSYNSGRYCEAPEESLREEATDHVEELPQEYALVRTLSSRISTSPIAFSLAASSYSRRSCGQDKGSPAKYIAIGLTNARATCRKCNPKR
jgi:hypothetical protein